MIDGKEGLRAYVAMKVEAIISGKEREGIVPAIATELDVIRGIREDVLEEMRNLYRGCLYTGTTTLNQPALKRKEK